MSTARPLLLPATLLILLAGCQCGRAAGTCSTKDDCTFKEQPICNPTTHECVACIDDTQCPVGFICGDADTCVPGCRSDHDRCSLGLYCDQGKGCVACVTDGQCGTGRVCKNSGCVDGCSTANPSCPQGLVCDTNSGTCVACVLGTDCTNPQLPVCNPASHSCVECLANADCHDPAHPICDPSSNTCVGCLQDNQCQAGFVCTNRTCTPGCNANQACPTGQHCNTAMGQCVQCLGDNDCSGATPRCDTSTNTCVACLPASDNCPTGEYCRPDHVCEQGCKTGADCPSGTCLPNHSCANCTADSQCAAGQVCSNGTCIEMCSTTVPCGAGKDCCGGHCYDLKNDPVHCGSCTNACGSGDSCCNGSCAALNTPSNCGACGTACGAGQGCCGSTATCTTLNALNNCGACGVTCGADQFCDGTMCRNIVFPEFCANKNVYAIYDGLTLDDAATNTLASTIAQYCSSQTNIVYGQQTNAQWVDQTTGALLLGGGSTVVTAGGPFPNKPVKWLERTDQVTKVYFDTNGIDTYYFKKRVDGSVLVTRPQTYCSTASTQDVFLVELSADPTSGTLALIEYGLCGGGYGTRSGAWFWANTMLPNRASYPNSWYIYEWTDQNANAQPDAIDTFTLLATGQ